MADNRACRICAAPSFHLVGMVVDACRGGCSPGCPYRQRHRRPARAPVRCRSQALSRCVHRCSGGRQSLSTKGCSALFISITNSLIPKRGRCCSPCWTRMRSSAVSPVACRLCSRSTSCGSDLSRHFLPGLRCLQAGAGPESLQLSRSGPGG